MDPLLEVYPNGDFKTEPNQDDKHVDIKEELLDEPIDAAHFEECFVSSLPEFNPIESELDLEPNEKRRRSFVSPFPADLNVACKSEYVDEYGDWLCDESGDGCDPYADRYDCERDTNGDGQTMAASMTEACQVENAADDPVVTRQRGLKVAVAPKSFCTQVNGKEQVRPELDCERMWVGDDGYQFPSEAGANEDADADEFIRKQDVLRLKSMLEQARAARDELAIDGHGLATGGVPIARSVDDCLPAESMAEYEGDGEMTALSLSEACQLENPDDEPDNLLVSSLTPQPQPLDTVAILVPKTCCDMTKDSKTAKMQDQRVSDCEKIWVSKDFDRCCNEIRNNTRRSKADRSNNNVDVLHLKSLAARNAELAIDDSDLATVFSRSDDRGGELAQSNDVCQPAQSMADDEGGGPMMAPPLTEASQIEHVDDEPAGPLIKRLSLQSGFKDKILTPKQKEGNKTQGSPLTVSGGNFDTAVTLLTGCDEIRVVENEEQARALSLTTSGPQSQLKSYKLKVRAENSYCLEQELKWSNCDFNDGIVIVKPSDEPRCEFEFEEFEFEFEQQSTEGKRRKIRKIEPQLPEAKVLYPSMSDCLICGSGYGKPNGEVESDSQDKVRWIVENECAKAEAPKTDRRKQTIVFRLEGPDDTAPPSKAKVPFPVRRSIHEVDQCRNSKVEKWTKFFNDNVANKPDVRRRFKRPKCNDKLPPNDRFGNSKAETWEEVFDDNVANGPDDCRRLKRPKCKDTLPPKAKKPLIMSKPSCKGDKFGNQGSSIVGQPSSKNNAGTVIKGDCLPAAKSVKANRRKQSIVCKPELMLARDPTLSASDDEVDMILSYGEVVVEAAQIDRKLEAQATQIDSDVMLTDIDNDKAGKPQTNGNAEILSDKRSPFFVCSVCDKAFLSRSTLAVHRRTHYGTQAFQCLECDVTFCTDFGLECHVCSAPDALGFVCSRCRRRLPSEWSVVAHECRGGTRMQTQTRAACEICGLNLTRRLLLRHMVETHPDVMASWNLAVGDDGGAELSGGGDLTAARFDAWNARRKGVERKMSNLRSYSF